VNRRQKLPTYLRPRSPHGARAAAVQFINDKGPEHGQHGWTWQRMTNASYLTQHGKTRPNSCSHVSAHADVAVEIDYEPQNLEWGCKMSHRCSENTAQNSPGHTPFQVKCFFSVEGEAIHPAQGASPVGANFRLKLNVLDPPVRTPEKILPPGRCNYVEVILIENKRLSGFSDTL